MKSLLLIFIIIPALEIGLFILSGNTIGVIPTMILIILSGIIGAYLVKYQGLETLRKVRLQLQNGIIPRKEIVDGICILFGGILLLTPGFITDIIGLILLLPPTRIMVKPLILKQFKKWIDRKSITIYR
jgi:UPF0716 protein FxsA